MPPPPVTLLRLHQLLLPMYVESVNVQQRELLIAVLHWIGDVDRWRDGRDRWRGMKH